MLAIHNDNGGYVETYIQREQYTHGERIKITGRCASACTIFLHNPNVCATATASFWFHSAYVGGEDRKGHFVFVREDPETTQEMMSYYPPLVRNFIQTYRPFGLNRQMLVLSGKQMLSMIQECR